jgi:Ca2+-binding RTX toxin-like protein
LGHESKELAMSTQGIAAGARRPPLPSQGAPVKGEGSYSMPGGANVSLKNGKLSVTGGKGKDAIDVQRLPNGNYGVNVNGQTLQFGASQVKELAIHGGKGNDNIRVGHGVDVKTTIEGGKGSDKIVNHAHDAFIRGGRGDDRIVNTGRGAQIRGSRGEDSIFNTGRGAQIHGGRGDDRIFNRGAFSQIDGGRGHDGIFNRGFAARVRGGLGNDSIFNRGAFSQINGGRGHDGIFNTGRASHLDGGRGFNSVQDFGRGLGRGAFFGGGPAFQRFDMAHFFQQPLRFGF